MPIPRYWWSIFLLNYFDLEMSNPVLAPDYKKKKKKKKKVRHMVINEYILSCLYQVFFIQILEEGILHFWENNKEVQRSRTVHCESQPRRKMNQQKVISVVAFNSSFQWFQYCTRVQ